MKPKLSDPVPTRFSPDLKKFLSTTHARTGLSESEVVRRSVRLLKQSVRAQNGYTCLLHLV